MNNFIQKTAFVPGHDHRAMLETLNRFVSDEKARLFFRSLSTKTYATAQEIEFQDVTFQKDFEYAIFYVAEPPEKLYIEFNEYTGEIIQFSKDVPTAGKKKNIYTYYRGAE